MRHEVRTYAGAPHSFFDRAHEDHDEASAEAWDLVRRFLAASAAQRT